MGRAYYSAGILIYKVCGDNIQVLLGCDNKYKCWSDFGGKCEWIDNNDPLKTASREFYEETSGVIASESTIYKHLKRNGICIKCKSYNNHEYNMYLLNDQHIHVSNDCVIDFEKQQSILTNKSQPTNRNNMKYIEKSSIDWLFLDDILKNPELYRGVFLESIRCNYEILQQKCVNV